MARINLLKVAIMFVVVAVVVMNLMVTELSPQHAEFLDIFFIQFPKTVIIRLFSAFI